MNGKSAKGDSKLFILAVEGDYDSKRLKKRAVDKTVVEGCSKGS
jgi:hypothetical protein